MPTNWCTEGWKKQLLYTVEITHPARSHDNNKNIA